MDATSTSETSSTDPCDLHPALNSSSPQCAKISAKLKRQSETNSNPGLATSAVELAFNSTAFLSVPFPVGNGFCQRATAPPSFLQMSTRLARFQLQRNEQRKFRNCELRATDNLV